MLKRHFRPGDRVVVESPIYRLGHNDHTRDAFNTDNSLGREGTVAYPSRDYAGDVRVHLDEVGYTLAFHPKGLLHVDDLPALAAERAPAPVALGVSATGSPIFEGDEVVVESAVFRYAKGGDLQSWTVAYTPRVGDVGIVEAADYAGDILVNLSGRGAVAPEGLLLTSELDDLATVRAPRYSRGDRVEVVRSEFLYNGEVREHYGFGVPKVGEIVTVDGPAELGVHAGNVLVGIYVLDPAAVRPAPVVEEAAPAYSRGDRVEVVRSEYLWNGIVETHPLSDAPKVGDIVTVCDDGVVAGHELAAGNLTVGDDVDADGGFLLDPAAVRSAPPVEASPVDGEPLADWERELYLGTAMHEAAEALAEPAPARPKPGDLVELVEPGVVTWTTPSGILGRMTVRSFFQTPEVVSAVAPMHPDNIVVGEGFNVHASAVRVVPAPVEEEPAPASSKCSADCWLCSPTAEAEWKDATPRSSAASDEVVETLREILAPKPAPASRTWSHRDDAGDLVKVSAESTYVEIELSGTYAVTRDEIEGDVATAELSPVAARQLAASIVAAADAVSPAPSLADYSFPRRWIVGAPAHVPTFGLPEVSLTERIADYYR